MRPGRELDVLVAQEVMGHKVFVKNKKLFEETPVGERPLRLYDSDLNHAWEVVEKMNITVIPVQADAWFAFVGREHRWQSPAEFLEFLQKGEFLGCGAAVGKNPPKVICQAAINALQKRAEESRLQTEGAGHDNLEAAGTSPATLEAGENHDSGESRVPGESHEPGESLDSDESPDSDEDDGSDGNPSRRPRATPPEANP
ncbi:MAG TPA: hypothetical protein VFV50_04320 [Bdellovibrionales bacterium]|nr:hypothetical protein [Bdellovibrionales bacterium]